MDELAHPTHIQPFWFTASAHANIVIVWQRIERSVTTPMISPVVVLQTVQTQSAKQSAEWIMDVEPASTMVHRTHPDVDPQAFAAGV